MVIYEKPYKRHNVFELVLRSPESALSLSSMACKNHHLFLSSLWSVEKFEMFLGYFIPKVNSYLREGILVFLNSYLHIGMAVCLGMEHMT